MEAEDYLFNTGELKSGSKSYSSHVIRWKLSLNKEETETVVATAVTASTDSVLNYIQFATVYKTGGRSR
jgi:hypothetical protein